jgi:hypothetical protein
LLPPLLLQLLLLLLLLLLLRLLVVVVVVVVVASLTTAMVSIRANPFRIVVLVSALDLVVVICFTFTPNLSTVFKAAEPDHPPTAHTPSS